MATKRKPKKFTPKEVKVGNRKLWQIYLGSEVQVRDGVKVRVPNRKTFADRHEANQYCELLRIQRTNFGTAALTISEHLRTQAVEAAKILEPFNVSLVELARKYADEQHALKKSRDTEGAVKDYLEAAIADGRSKRYTDDLRSRLGRFTRDFGSTSLSRIDTTTLDAWLRGLGVGAVSRNSYRRRLVSFFTYAVDRNWTLVNPAAKTSIAKERPGAIGILSPEELSRLLSNASELTLPYLAIGAFGGIRSAELERLDWQDVKFEAGLIEVGADKSKTAAKRYVHIQPALEAWLEPYRNARGPICPSNLPKLLRTDRQRAGIIKWPKNALRHSYASYHLANFKNAAELSLEMGHVSPHLIFKHYRELVRPEIAKQWWNIMPPVANVMRMSA